MKPKPSKLKSSLTGRTVSHAARTSDAEELARARETIAEQKVKLEKMRRRMAKKDQELAKLRAAPGGVEAPTEGVRPENIIWVFGTAKTGSTWLESMMRGPQGHYAWREPNVGNLFGTHYYEKAEGKYANNKSSNRHWEHSWILAQGHREAWIRSIRSFVLDGARARFPQMTDSSYLVIKEPHGSHGAPLLMEALPESRFVFLIRDPRDVASSALAARVKGSWLYERYHERRGGEDTLGDMPPDEIVRDRARQYQRDISKVKEAYEAHEGHKVLVRYEDLRANTLDTMKCMYTALDISVDEGELARAVEKRAYENFPEEKKGQGKSRRKATPGGWKEDLTPEQVKTVEGITAPLLEEFYPG